MKFLKKWKLNNKKFPQVHQVYKYTRVKNMKIIDVLAQLAKQKENTILNWVIQPLHHFVITYRVNIYLFIMKASFHTF